MRLFAAWGGLAAVPRSVAIAATAVFWAAAAAAVLVVIYAAAAIVVHGSVAFG